MIFFFFQAEAGIRSLVRSRGLGDVYKRQAQDTAPLALEAILKAGSYDLGAKAKRIEDPAEWTASKLAEKAKLLNADKGAKGNFDD